MKRIVVSFASGLAWAEVVGVEAAVMGDMLPLRMSSRGLVRGFLPFGSLMPLVVLTPFVVGFFLALPV